MKGSSVHGKYSLLKEEVAYHLVLECLLGPETPELGKVPSNFNIEKHWRLRYFPNQVYPKTIRLVLEQPMEKPQKSRSAKRSASQNSPMPTNSKEDTSIAIYESSHIEANQPDLLPESRNMVAVIEAVKRVEIAHQEERAEQSECLPWKGWSMKRQL